MGSGGGNAGGGGGGGGPPTGSATGGAAGEVVPPAKEPGMAGATFPDDPVTNPGGVLTGPGVKAEQLAAKDSGPARAYTGAHVEGFDHYAGLNAEKLNRTLYDPAGVRRTLEMAGESQAYIDDFFKRASRYQKELNTSLDKMKSYQGQTYRTVSDSGGQLAAKYQPGKPVTMKEFVSASRSTNPSYKPYDLASTGSTRFIIQSKSGKLVEKISQYQAEREVLFKSGSKFMVTSKKFNSERGTWDISLKEL